MTTETDVLIDYGFTQDEADSALWRRGSLEVTLFGSSAWTLRNTACPYRSLTYTGPGELAYALSAGLESFVASTQEERSRG